MDKIVKGGRDAYLKNHAEKRGITPAELVAELADDGSKNHTNMDEIVKGGRDAYLKNHAEKRGMTPAELVAELANDGSENHTTDKIIKGGRDSYLKEYAEKHNTTVDELEAKLADDGSKDRDTMSTIVKERRSVILEEYAKKYNMTVDEFEAKLADDGPKDHDATDKIIKSGRNAYLGAYAEKRGITPDELAAELADDGSKNNDSQLNHDAERVISYLVDKRNLAGLAIAPSIKGVDIAAHCKSSSDYTDLVSSIVPSISENYGVSVGVNSSHNGVVDNNPKPGKFSISFDCRSLRPEDIGNPINYYVIDDLDKDQFLQLHADLSNILAPRGVDTKYCDLENNVHTALFTDTADIRYNYFDKWGVPNQDAHAILNKLDDQPLTQNDIIQGLNELRDRGASLPSSDADIVNKAESLYAERLQLNNDAKQVMSYLVDKRNLAGLAMAPSTTGVDIASRCRELPNFEAVNNYEALATTAVPLISKNYGVSVDVSPSHNGIVASNPEPGKFSISFRRCDLDPNNIEASNNYYVINNLDKDQFLQLHADLSNILAPRGIDAKYCDPDNNVHTALLADTADIRYKYLDNWGVPNQDAHDVLKKLDSQPLTQDHIVRGIDELKERSIFVTSPEAKIVDKVQSLYADRSALAPQTNIEVAAELKEPTRADIAKSKLYAAMKTYYGDDKAVTADRSIAD